MFQLISRINLKSNQLFKKFNILSYDSHGSVHFMNRQNLKRTFATKKKRIVELDSSKISFDSISTEKDK